MTRRLFNLAALLLPWLRPAEGKGSLTYFEMPDWTGRNIQRCKCGKHDRQVLIMSGLEGHSFRGCQKFANAEEASKFLISIRPTSVE